MQPLPGGGYKPYQAMVTQWSGAYENVTYEENNGHPLLEDSKATCPIGGKDCISIINHGQVAEITNRNLHNADPIKMDMINPFMDFATFRNQKEMSKTPKLIDYYITDVEGNRIESDITNYIGDKIIVHIETQDLINDRININMNNKFIDFIYKGEKLEKDTLKNYEITKNHEEIELFIEKEY